MGCFLACFGSSKDRKTRKQRHKINATYNAQSTVSLERSNFETPISPVKEVRGDKAEEQLGSGSSPQKKVTFDTNIKTCEHVLVDESTDLNLLNEKDGEKKGKVKEKNLAKPRESEASSEQSSVTSSSSSFPPNHRYQNCRESDNEDDELDCEESDLDDDEDDDYEDFDDGAVESRDRIRGLVGVTEEINGLVEEEVKLIGLIRGVRDGNGNVHPVLNPVENMTQWKAVKAKGATPFKLQKENLSLEHEEPRLSFSSELSFSFKSKSDHEPKKLNEEVSVDASLSNWLSSTETTPVKKSSTFDAGTSTTERSMSQGSNSLRSPEDRPILGALTLEEIKKFSASSSPRKSPSRSPDEMPIIGTVGTYWSHVSTTKDSDSATTFKGIPNTTSKYSTERIRK
ncbi:nuclear polyadenylated RNA-binding protein 3-like [Durio zibethinus]|uniref:Nuclear polyadenylated RNA-binding protein 3-like n=1 Tax=Durio zibethinus TaxID=66656 RepID=A0A6P6A449_DURZI|nr:nuclear polyadenylated RNA-binding protein 3-like [Durio zibethinus]